MRPDVYVANVDCVYDRFPYTNDNSSILRGLRAMWAGWGYDPDNPFKGLIGPGNKVVIKPNWVMDNNPLGRCIDSLITHTSLIKYMIDFCAKAMEGEGTIVIGDCPLQSCNFSELLKNSRTKEIVELAKERHPGLKIITEDWRLTVIKKRKTAAKFFYDLEQSFEDDLDESVTGKYELVDMGTDSFLEEISDYAKYFRVTMYKPSLMLAHHRHGKHEYLITKRIFDADLLINLPKVKTHIKAGLTGALKNLVGINGHKEFLPHHIRGSYFSGGDCYCVDNRFSNWADRLYDNWWQRYTKISTARRRIYAGLYSFLQIMACFSGGGAISAGSWSGNETLWRTIMDLNHILYFGPRSPRHVLTIVDGVIAGEGQGPLCPLPKQAGILIGGQNPAYIDAVIAKLMGYNISRIPSVYNAVYLGKSKFAGPFLEDFNVLSISGNGETQSVPFNELPNLDFVKPRYWRRADAGGLDEE